MEAILTSTKTAAEALGLEKKIGTLEQGKFADLIAVSANPLDDISVLQNKEDIKFIMKEGSVVVDRR